MSPIQVLKLCIMLSLVVALQIAIVLMVKMSEEDELRGYVKQVVYGQKVQLNDENNLGEPSYIMQGNEPFTVDQESLQKLQKSYEPSVHIFYYPWYGNPDYDGGRYYHWNHALLKPSPRSKMKSRNHTPPDDIASMFYPQLGPYSSRNPAVIEKHMKWISSAGIDVLAISWYPSGKADEQGYPWDSMMPTLLNASEKYDLKVAFHLEPYPEQTALSVRNDIEYIIRNYGHFPAFHRIYPKKKRVKKLPLFYIYDSYKISNEDWSEVALPSGSLSIRDTEFDSILVGLALKVDSIAPMAASGFDGVYTYFAADGFTEGSTMSLWPKISQICSQYSILFIPSVGPGYDDSRIRPWNSQNTRSRAGGSYYKQHFEMAHAAKADLVSITSFNEFHEATQIEPVIPFQDKNGTMFVYESYEKGPDQYLQLTHKMINTYFTAHHKNIPINIAKIV